MRNGRFPVHKREVCGAPRPRLGGERPCAAPQTSAISCLRLATSIFTVAPHCKPPGLADVSKVSGAPRP